MGHRSTSFVAYARVIAWRRGKDKGLLFIPESGGENTHDAGGVPEQTTGLHVCIGSCAGNQRELRASRLKQREWHAEINSTCLCERAERHKYSIHSSTAHYFNVVTRRNRPPLHDAYQLCAYIRCHVSGSIRLNSCTNPDSLSRRNHTTGPLARTSQSSIPEV